MKAKVSIIIPVYNAEKFIKRCINSCINQSFQAIEIILVNDGSTDSSETIINQFTDQRIKLINKVNAGVNLARKTGIQNAKGPYLFFLDADDSLEPQAIQHLYEKSENETADLVVGDVQIYSQNKVTERRYYSEFNGTTGLEFLEYILTKRLHYLWGKLIKKVLYTEQSIITNKNVKIGEDQIQMIQLCYFAKKITVTPQVIYNYVHNDSSVTQRKEDPRVFTGNHEAYAHGIYELKHLFNFNTLVSQQLNLRILWALFGAIGTSKQFVYNPKKSTRILYNTIFKATFSKNSLIFKHYKLLFKAFTYPIAFKLLKSKP